MIDSLSLQVESQSCARLSPLGRRNTQGRVALGAGPANRKHNSTLPLSKGDPLSPAAQPQRSVFVKEFSCAP